MSLDYVHKGEAVKASTVNSIIDTLGGNQRMSPDLNVTTTARGPQVSLPSDYGGPNQKPDHILDVGRYMLSGWPMVKLELGFTIGDCLGAMRYYRADGTASTPVSAAVVYQNSEDCPTGSDISGYALVSSDFGKDAAAHAAGWVDTLIEDPYPGGVLRAQLWKYKSGAELAEVFTNVEDELSVQEQLSSLLSAHGASGEDLSTLKIVGSWSLVESAKLSADGQQSLVPTHEIVCKHGTIDCYEYGGFDYNAVLKASLECIDVQKNGSGEVQSTTWAWKIPLGPDAECSQGKAHSSSVTYGGNEVLFEVEEGEIGPDFSGDATYNGKAIWYGCYETEAGEEVDADDVWLNLSYDYQLKATKGAFSSSKDSGSYTQDGILSRNVFVVKTSGFTPSADTSKGDKAPAEVLEHGTWGVLPKDGPKLDTYCPVDSEKSFKSLDWADREGDVVSCECAELHEFDQLETVEPLSTDHLVIRRPDDYDGAELKYIPLSALSGGMYVPPDADVPAAETSSIQTRVLPDDSRVEELFQFHVPGTVDVRISDLVSVDFVLRNPNSGQPYVEYGKLCIDIAPDAQGTSGQKSIDWLSDTHELQLYKFDEDGLSAFEPDVTVNSNRESLLPEEYEFVLRKNGAGGEVTYGQVALSVNMEELSGDSQVSEQKSISVSNNVIELYKMGEAGQDVSSEVPTHFDEPQSILSDDCEFVIRKGGAGGEIDYTTVKLRQAMLSVDRQGHPNQKSLQYADLGDGTFLELNGFHADGTTKPKVALTSADTSLLPADNEFLIRRKVNGFWQLEYAPLSVSISGDTLVDSQVLRNQKSLEYVSGNDGDYIQLYDMDAAGQPSEQVDLKFAKDSYQDLLPDDEEFVIRTRAGGVIQYKNVGVCLSAYLSGVADAISGDNEKTPSQKSIDLVFDGDDPDYYQLHDMDKAGTSLPRKAITMSADGYTPLLPSNYEFVLRQNGAGGTIKYANLSCCIPDLSALSATIVSGDNEVVVARKSIDFINEPGSDPYYQLHDFQTSAVNGPDTWLKFWDQPLSGEDFSIGCQTQFVVRVPNGVNGYEVKYMQLSAYQQHERVDTGTMTPRGRSIDYTAYDEGYGCYNVLELYGFDWGCSHFITSADISSQYGNGILIRKWDDYGCCWQLDYMHFDSLDELAIKYIGDSQLSLSAHNPYQRSAEVIYDQADQKKYVQLYGFDTDIDNASVTIHNDGCTYYWPQDVRTDQQLYEWDYILVKHIDSSGNITLQYKQLEVTMPDIDVNQIEGDIQNIYGDIQNFYDEINYLSGCIDDLSGSLSGSYWESGGYSDTCYGHSIGDSTGCLAIDLDNRTFYGSYWWFTGHQGGGWFGGNNLDVEGIADIQSLQLDHLGNGDGLTFANGCTYIYNTNSYFDGTVGVGCQINVGCSYFTESSLRVGCTLTIGSTTIDEAQLSALLRLASQAPQMLQNI